MSASEDACDDEAEVREEHAVLVAPDAEVGTTPRCS